jgi:alpha-galactosidase
MDGGWQVSRDAQGTIQPDPNAFPSGIPALVDYVHSKKLKFGLYSGIYIEFYVSILHICIVFVDQLDRGNLTCDRRPGSLGYETKDANTYALWRVDYLKLDSCYTDATPTEVEYSKMRDALNATGRPIFYSLCGMHINYVYFSVCSLAFVYYRWYWSQ